MSNEIAIKVDDVSKTFKLPHEKNTSIKSSVIGFWKNKKGYEKQQALKGVSFDINKGDFFGIVGRNGSGKSTLLKMLAGIYSPDEGNIHVNGKLTPFIELGVGFNPELSGRENVFLNGALLGFSRKEMNAMYDDIVEFSEIERFMDQKLKNYSSGMQVRLAFSIAIRAQTDILILDEVLAVGDAAFQQKCYNYFEELKTKNTTVVFVSHSMEAVQRFCNKAIYIKDGLLTHQGTPSEIADVYLEENMESSQAASSKDKNNASQKHTLAAELLEQTKESVKIKFTYTCKESDEHYIGISLSKDGVSIAEITTSHQQPLNKESGEVIYELDTSVLNGGVYQVGAGLFKQIESELLAMTHDKTQFILKGSDPTRGAALKLRDTWKYE